MLVNLSTYIRNENENNSSIIEEWRELKFQKCPIYSARIIRYALLVRYTSFQAYKLLLEEFPMPSLSLLEKISEGGVDPVKSVKLLLAKGRISEDVILIYLFIPNYIASINFTISCLHNLKISSDKIINYIIKQNNNKSHPTLP